MLFTCGAEKQSWSAATDHRLHKLFEAASGTSTEAEFRAGRIPPSKLTSSHDRHWLN